MERGGEGQAGGRQQRRTARREQLEALPWPASASNLPPQVLRGTTVTVSGSNFPSEAGAITVQLNGVSVTPAPVVGPGGKSFTFVVPPGLPLGWYVVRSVFRLTGDRTAGPVLVRVPGQQDRLRVLPDAPDKLKLAAVFPAVSYPDRHQFPSASSGTGSAPSPRTTGLSWTAAASCRSGGRRSRPARRRRQA